MGTGRGKATNPRAKFAQFQRRDLSDGLMGSWAVWELSKYEHHVRMSRIWTVGDAKAKSQEMVLVARKVWEEFCK